MLSVTPDRRAILRRMKGRGGSDECGCALFVIVVTAFFC
jgi:hypothetical protein